MFATTLIVFRESLEAALFIGIVAAAARGLAQRGRWLASGILAGAAGSLVLAMLGQQLGGWLDGLGHDLVTIVVLALAIVLLLWHCVFLSAHGRAMAVEARRLGHEVQAGQRRAWALAAVVALAVLREGAETVLFVGGLVAGDGKATAAGVLAAAAAGLVGGAVAGTAIYLGLSRIPVRHLFTVTNTLVALLAGAMASQLARTLAQAGVLDTWTSPLWDSSAWVAPDSTAGALLRGLVGYDATPSGAQITAYLGVLALIVAGTRLLAARPPVHAAG